MQQAATDSDDVSPGRADRARDGPAGALG